MRPSSLLSILLLVGGVCRPVSAADAVTVDGSGNMAVIGQVTAPNVLQGSTGVNVTAAVTLSAFGSWHWISGTTADYTITLPTAVGNSGKTIGLRVKDAAVASKTYTLAASSGQNIDGVTAIALTANTTLVVMSDGTGWARVSGTPSAVHVEASSDAGQGVTSMATDYQYEDEQIDTHGAWNGTVFTAPVAGVYFISASAYFNANIGDAMILRKNNADYDTNTSASNDRTAYSKTIKLAVGDTLAIRGFLTRTRLSNIIGNRISITRVGD